jgi:hypothetical protein
MNRFQKIVVAGALIDILLLFLFPPYDMVAFGRGAPMFDAFHPVFSVPPNRVINGNVLYILAFGVLINACLAWLLVAGPKSRPGMPRVDPRIVVVAFGIVNFALVLLFPPMEAFPFAQRVTVGTFDGFYFAFGDKSRRSIFVPLLYVESLFVLTNACAYWLAMSIASRAAGSEPAIQPPQPDRPQARPVLERGPERRKGAEPAFKGQNRRSRAERRRGKNR